MCYFAILSLLLILRIKLISDEEYKNCFKQESMNGKKSLFLSMPACWIPFILPMDRWMQLENSKPTINLLKWWLWRWQMMIVMMMMIMVIFFQTYFHDSLMIIAFQNDGGSLILRHNVMLSAHYSAKAQNTVCYVIYVSICDMIKLNQSFVGNINCKI